MSLEAGRPEFLRILPDNPLLAGTLASLIAGAATGLGAAPMLLIRRLTDRWQDTLLGFAAGVMLAASFFSLIIPALDIVEHSGHSRSSAALTVLTAVLLGAAVLWLINRTVPHEHFIPQAHSPLHAAKLRRIWLFVLAITLHNVPEGLAVGVGFGGGDLAQGRTIALAIGLQNMPEGLAVAASLIGLNYRRSVAVGVALLTGLVEPLGGLLGAAATSLSQPLLPWGLGFAAGAMLFVISNEIIPETHRQGHETMATGGVMVGLAVMMYLDVTLG